MEELNNLYREYKLITLPKESILNAAAIQTLDTLLDSTNPQELREDLLELYHSYIVHEHQALPLDFDRMANNLNRLFETLATMSKAVGRENVSGNEPFRSPL
jgi:hypothetical protein